MSSRNYRRAGRVHVYLTPDAVVPIALFCLITVATLAFAEIRFESVTKSVGIAYTGETFGASWGDFNGDGPLWWLPLVGLQ